MSILNLHGSYFSIDNPLSKLERWFHRYRYRAAVVINRRPVEVCWTARAERAMRKLERPLLVEMQLYFSCVVKKRVLFHDHSELAMVEVNRRLQLAFNPVASAACDPQTFAQSHPGGRDLSANAAAKMLPRVVEIDYRRQRWQGQFHY